MQINVPTLNILIYYYLFISRFLDFYLTLPIHSSLVYLFMLTHTQKTKTNKQKQCKITHNSSRFEPPTPRWQINKNEHVTGWTTTSCVILSDFNNYIKFYIIMSASHEFTIFVFTIYWKGTQKLSAIQTQSLITRSYRQWTQVFARFQFSLYISYKTTIFQKLILKSIHTRFR